MTALPVQVILTVTKFNDVLDTKAARGGRGTEFTMEVREKDSRVILKGDDIYISPPGATLQFTIASAADDKERYFPVGISFLRERQPSKTDEQRLGLLNFPQAETRLEGQTITITDTYKDDTPDIRYKFSVMIQRGSDGEIGIIDPGIVHELG